MSSRGESRPVDQPHLDGSSSPQASHVGRPYPSVSCGNPHLRGLHGACSNFPPECPAGLHQPVADSADLLVHKDGTKRLKTSWVVERTDDRLTFGDRERQHPRHPRVRRFQPGAEVVVGLSGLGRHESVVV
jgi:hypothetical protein